MPLLKLSSLKGGAKARNIARMAEIKLPVLPGFIYEGSTDPMSLTDTELQNLTNELGGFPLIVRSAHESEDLADASFAGQYLSVSFITSLDQLRAAIESVLNSAVNASENSYRTQKEVGSARAFALIQAQYRCDRAGVAFSMDPISGQEEMARVEWVAGNNEDLLSGRQAGESFGLPLKTDPTGTEAAWDKQQLQELKELLLSIQALFGHPQDVEWGWNSKDGFRIFQARPITRTQWRKDHIELTSADLREGGVSSQVCSPFMFGVYKRAFDAGFEDYSRAVGLKRKSDPAEQWLHMYYGRVYWDLNLVKKYLFRIPGFSEKRFDESLGIVKNYGDKGPHHTRLSVLGILQALPMVQKLAKEYKNQAEFVSGFKNEFERYEKRFRKSNADIASFSDTDFFRELEALIETQCLIETQYCRTISNSSNAQTEFFDVLRKVTEDHKIQVSSVVLLAGLTQITHLRLQEDLHRLYELSKQHRLDSLKFKMGAARFIEDHYYHSSKELDLTVPRWIEQPEFLPYWIQNFHDRGLTPADPSLTSSQKGKEARETLNAICADLRKKSLSGRWLARQLEKKWLHGRQYLLLREQMRDYSSRAYAWLRFFVLDAGRRLTERGLLASPNQIFFLYPDEILAALSNGRMPVDLKTRELFYRAYSNFNAPGEFGSALVSIPTAAAASPGALQGLAASPGVVEGRAVVLFEADAHHVVRDGDILVTRFTDPGWTPLLGIVAGLVTEVGGVLCHGAIISREYGIPAVIGIAGVTSSIKSGDWIRIDGFRGLVEILDRPAQELSQNETHPIQNPLPMPTDKSL